MKRVHPNECIPASFHNGLVEFESVQDLMYLGKENLAVLAQFWEERKERFSKKLAKENDLRRRDDIRFEVEQCGARWSYLKSIMGNSESKPVFFAKPVISTGTKVACFATDPDRYIVGVVVKIDRDENSGTGSFIIRTYDRKLAESVDLKYTPDGFSMFLADDIDYYRAHPGYFRYVLNYLARPSNPQEIDYADRLVAALHQPTTSDQPNVE